MKKSRKKTIIVSALSAALSVQVIDRRPSFGQASNCGTAMPPTAPSLNQNAGATGSENPVQTGTTGCANNNQGNGCSYDTTVDVTGLQGGAPFSIGATVQLGTQQDVQMSALGGAGQHISLSDLSDVADLVPQEILDKGAKILQRIDPQAGALAQDALLLKKAQDFYNQAKDAIQNNQDVQFWTNQLQQFNNALSQAIQDSKKAAAQAITPDPNANSGGGSAGCASGCSGGSPGVSPADKLRAVLNQLNQQVANHPQSIQNAINDSPPPTYNPNDDPQTQMRQAYANDDYHKIAELAPRLEASDSVQLNNDLIRASKAAAGVISDPSATPAQKQAALNFLNGLPGEMEAVANGLSATDPAGASRLRESAQQTRLMHDQESDFLQRTLNHGH